jgi:dimethylhistidine N-methyltransferase
MNTTLTFHNHKPETLSLQEAVVTGLSKAKKAIAPKFFYDQRGSELFDQICNQPEYYPPTIEQSILSSNADEIANLAGEGRVLVEPGAGSAAKVRLLLNNLQPSAYVPMDISFDHLKSAATDLSNDYPWLPVHATCVDFTHSLPIPDVVPNGPRMLFFPGSSIGNFERKEANEFLSMIHDAIGKNGMLLIGVDTKKNEDILNAAYNDEAGVTAEFNMNLLLRIKKELGIDFSLDNFKHNAYYNSDAGRIEMHLVSTRKQTLNINGHTIILDKDESVHTENSYKYSPDEFITLAENNNFEPVKFWTDTDNLFAVYLMKIH